MKIRKVISHVLEHALTQELGYSQQYYAKRTVHLIEIQTDDGLTGWGECFGPGGIAHANRAIIYKVIAPMIEGMDALDRDAIWHKVYNLLRDHGQKGMPIQALSGIDIALWDLLGKVAGLPLYQLIGGKHRDQIKVYGYGMMLRREDPATLAARFTQEAQAIKERGFSAVKMKIGLGPQADVKLAQAVRTGVGDDFHFMADANHAYNTSDALYVGRALEEMGATWFEEPIAPEDHDGYRELRSKLKVAIAGGEAEFTRWGWRHLLQGRCVDIAQPEVCGLGGISEYLRVTAMAQAHFIPVINHVWGSDIATAVNLHLLCAQPPMPGGLHPAEPMLEFDTTESRFRDEMMIEPLQIENQVRNNQSYVRIPNKPGIGVEPDKTYIKSFAIT
ncbi:MAG: mandelate racemase/muconate lactonizing enzyme family protein [Pseudomonadota bacterium]